MPVGDTWELGVRGTAHGQTIVNVFHWFEGAGDDTGSPEDLAALWETNVKTAYLAVQSEDYTLVDYAIRKASDPTFGQVIVPASGAVVGTRTGSVGVMGGAAVITWRTPQAGRSRRGRSYIGPLSESDTQSGVIVAGMVTAMTAFGNAHVGDIGSLPEPVYSAVVWSRLLSAPTVITGFTVRTNIRSMRTRNIGVGI